MTTELEKKRQRLAEQTRTNPQPPSEYEIETDRVRRALEEGRKTAEQRKSLGLPTNEQAQKSVALSTMLRYRENEHPAICMAKVDFAALIDGVHEIMVKSSNANVHRYCSLAIDDLESACDRVLKAISLPQKDVQDG